MSMEDLYAAIIGEPPEEQVRLKALAAQLRGQQDYGRLGMLTGDKVLAPLGSSIATGADSTAERLGQQASTNRWRKSQESMAKEAVLARAKEAEAMRQFQAQQNAENRALQRALAQQSQANALEIAKLRNTSGPYGRDLERLSKEYVKANLPELSAGFKTLDDALAPFRNEKGEIRGDVPGIGATGLVPGGLITPAGRPVRQAVSALRNIVLRARSGAAVTSQEQARVYEEIYTLLGGSDKDVLRGMDMLRSTVESQKEAIYAGFNPDTVATFDSRLQNDKPQAFDAATQAAAAAANPDADDFMSNLQNLNNDQLDALYEQLMLAEEQP